MLAVLLALVAGPPSAHTVAWEYYGLTQRSPAANCGATCAGVGARAAGGWRRFRCAADVRDVRVLACSGPVCPVH